MLTGELHAGASTPELGIAGLVLGGSREMCQYLGPIAGNGPRSRKVRKMTILAGFTPPDLSEYDPPVEGEGSLDPMGLAAISDRLAERLVPGLRSRMKRIRFVTAMAVGSLACETLDNVASDDGISTPAICFEWLVIESFARRLSAQELPSGIPGSQKARSVVTKNQRLSAATYLKGPSVFGFNGVYKPFAVDAGVIGSELEPGLRCAELVRAWEQDRAFHGFADAVPGTDGGKLRINVRDQVRASLEVGRCSVGLGSWLFGRLAAALRPDRALRGERQALRSLIMDGEHENRAELANRIERVEGELAESELLRAVRPYCSPSLGSIIDAVVAYEEFALLLDTAFRTLCAVSYSQGVQPLMAGDVQANDVIARCSRDLPGNYRLAEDRMAAIGASAGPEERLGVFAIPSSPPDLVELLLQHHETVQAGKSRSGKRPWFEPYRGGWIVRPPYGTTAPPEPRSGFVHPVRVGALSRFLEDTRT